MKEKIPKIDKIEREVSEIQSKNGIWEERQSAFKQQIEQIKKDVNQLKMNEVNWQKKCHPFRKPILHNNNILAERLEIQRGSSESAQWRNEANGSECPPPKPKCGKSK